MRWSRSHSRRQSRPLGPDRWRSKVTSKVGLPGAFPGSASDGPAATCQRVCAALVLDAGKTLDIEALRAWGKERMASFKVPKNIAALDKLPRNAMGKIIKPDVKMLFV